MPKTVAKQRLGGHTQNESQTGENQDWNPAISIKVEPEEWEWEYTRLLDEPASSPVNKIKTEHNLMPVKLEKVDEVPSPAKKIKKECNLMPVKLERVDKVPSSAKKIKKEPILMPVKLERMDELPLPAKKIKKESDLIPVKLKRMKARTDPHIVSGDMITGGTVILNEKPVLTLLDLSSYLVKDTTRSPDANNICFGCGTPNANQKCGSCLMTVCGCMCLKMENHSEWECKYVVRIRQDRILSRKEPGSNTHSARRLKVLDTMMMRMFILAQKNPVAYRELLQLVNQPRVKDLKENNRVYKELADTLDSWAWLSTNYWSLYKKKGSRNPIEDILALTLLVPIRGENTQQNLTFVYPTLTNWTTHSCVPNTDFVISDADNEVTLIAARNIQRNERIEVNLWQIALFTTSQRKAFLKKLHIQCQCKRCQDPTELDTFISGVRCSDEYCEGFYSPTSTDSEMDWKCRTCSDTISAGAVKTITVLLFEFPGERLRNLDDIYSHLQNLLLLSHSTHSTTLRVHQLVTRELAFSIFASGDDDQGKLLRVRELYSSTKALLWFYDSMKWVFHHDTAFVLLIHTLSEHYLQRQLLLMQKRVTNAADRAKAFVSSTNRLDLCKRVFSAYASIPKYAEYLAYVSEMQTMFRFQYRKECAQEGGIGQLIKIEPK